MNRTWWSFFLDLLGPHQFSTTISANIKMHLPGVPPYNIAEKYHPVWRYQSMLSHFVNIWELEKAMETISSDTLQVGVHMNLIG